MADFEIKSERELVRRYFIEGPGKETPVGRALANTLIKVYGRAMTLDEVLTTFIWQLNGQYWFPTRNTYDKYLAAVTGRLKPRRPRHPHCLVHRKKK